MTNFGQLPKSVDGIPIGEVYTPNTPNSDLTALEGGTRTQDGNNQWSAPAAVALKYSADTISSATTINAATTFSGVPTVSQVTANSSVLLTNPGGMATFMVAISVASAFNGTLSFYGLAPDGVTLQLISAHLRNSATIAASTAINTGSALSQFWTGSIAGFKAVYVVCTIATSGSALVQVGLTAAPYAVSISNTVNSNQAQYNGASVGITNPQFTDSAAQQGPINITNAGGASGGTSPTFTGTCTASADNSVTFASRVRTVQLHNQSAVNVPYEHDIAATATSPYLAPGQLAYVDVHTTTLHVFPSNALPINAASGLIVRGWA